MNPALESNSRGVSLRRQLNWPILVRIASFQMTNGWVEHGGTDSPQVRDGMAEFLQQHGQRIWIPAFNGVLRTAKQLLGIRA